MVDREQHKGLDQLRFDRRRTNGQYRLVREHRRSLGNGKNIAGKAEIFEISEEILVKNTLGTQIVDIRVLKVQFLDIVDQLLQTGGDRKAAVIRHRAEEHVKIDGAFVKAVFEVTVGHGELIKVTEHRHILMFHVVSLVSNSKSCGFAAIIYTSSKARPDHTASADRRSSSASWCRAAWRCCAKPRADRSTRRRPGNSDTAAWDGCPC